MSGRDLTNRLGWLQRMRSWNPLEFKQLDNMTALLAALGVHASLISASAYLDSADTLRVSQRCPLHTRLGLSVEHHVGKSSREIVGDLATQIEPTYEKVVLRTGNPVSVTLVGRVRDTRETGYWLDYCFPISRQVATSAAKTGLARCERYRGKGDRRRYQMRFPSALMRRRTPAFFRSLDESISAHYCRLVKSLEAPSFLFYRGCQEERTAFVCPWSSWTMTYG